MEISFRTEEGIIFQSVWSEISLFVFKTRFGPKVDINVTGIGDALVFMDLQIEMRNVRFIVGVRRHLPVGRERERDRQTETRTKSAKTKWNLKCQKIKNAPRVEKLIYITTYLLRARLLCSALRWPTFQIQFKSKHFERIIQYKQKEGVYLMW